MYSPEHINYLKKKRKTKVLIIFFQILILLSIIIIWELLAKYEIINPFISSSPSRILSTITNLYKSNNLFNHIWTTIYETIISFGLGTIIGLLIATILWWNKFLSRVIDPFLTMLNSLPKVALGPIIIIWFGAGIKSIIIMSLLISVIITIINVLDGFNKTDTNKIKLLKSFKANKSQIFFKLVLPFNYRTIISALKINISMSLIGLLPPVGEKIFFNKCYSRY